MSFISTNIGKDTKVLVKAQYNRILLAPFITLGVICAYIGYMVKKNLPGIVSEILLAAEVNVSQGILNGLANLIFILCLIFGVVYAVIMIIRTTGIELAATDSLLVGRYGKDAICVPLDKIENFAIFQNIIGKIFNFGTIFIGTPSTSMKFPFISKPEKIRDQILDLQDKKIH